MIQLMHRRLLLSYGQLTNVVQALLLMIRLMHRRLLLSYGQLTKVYYTGTAESD